MEPSPANPVTPTNRWRNLQQRTATGLVMGGVAVLFIWAGGWLYVTGMLLVALQLSREWERLIPNNSTRWRIFGMAYIIAPVLSALMLRDLNFVAGEYASIMAVLYPILLVVATDTGAFFVGRTVGGPKLAPRLSPNKTLSGLGGGMAASAVVAVLLLPWAAWPYDTVTAVLLGIVIAVLAQAGDLFESWLKRKSGLKDSGDLLPGHGGFLDRLDGYVITLPVYLLSVLSQAELLP